MTTKTIKKRAKWTLPLNNYSMLELSNLEEANKSFEKSQYGCFKIFDICLMLFIKNLKEILSES